MLEGRRCVGWVTSRASWATKLQIEMGDCGGGGRSLVVEVGIAASVGEQGSVELRRWRGQAGAARRSGGGAARHCSGGGRGFGTARVGVW